MASLLIVVRSGKGSTIASERTYLALVREWGSSADNYGRSHLSETVAREPQLDTIPAANSGKRSVAKRRVDTARLHVTATIRTPCAALHIESI